MKLMDMELEKKLGTFVFTYDCIKTIICTKVKSFNFTHNGGMDGEADGISELAKLTTLTRETALIGSYLFVSFFFTTFFYFSLSCIFTFSFSFFFLTSY